MKNKIKNISYKKIAFWIMISCILFIGTSKNVYAKAKNSNDVKALENIITVQRNRGSNVSTNVNNKNQYKWNKKTGRLQSINWHKKRLKGKISFNKLKGLKNIDISNNKVTKIYVDKLTKLEVLDCSKNKLTKLNVRRNKALGALDCSNNKLKNINVLKHKKLYDLNCSHNRLKKLKLDKSMQELFQLDCSYNKISPLSIDGLDMLENLGCDHNGMKKLVLKNLSDIYIFCDHNKLKYLDLSTVSVRELYCSYNKLESLDTYGVDRLDCSYNNIKELKGTLSMITLKCDHNQLTYLNIDKLCDELEEVYCQNNNITMLDFTEAKNLKKVVCDKEVKLNGLSKNTRVTRK